MILVTAIGYALMFSAPIALPNFAAAATAALAILLLRRHADAFVAYRAQRQLQKREEALQIERLESEYVRSLEAAITSVATVRRAQWMVVASSVVAEYSVREPNGMTRHAYKSLLESTQVAIIVLGISMLIRPELNALKEATENSQFPLSHFKVFTLLSTRDLEIKEARQAIEKLGASCDEIETKIRAYLP